MATAGAQAHRRMSPAFPCCVGFFLCIITVATVNEPALVQANHDHSPPTYLELYFPLEGDRVVITSPSGSKNESEYGTITAFNTIARASQAANSAVLGQGAGQLITTKDGSQFVTYTYLLNVAGYVGSISGQGVEDPLGNGDLAITGGTGDFLSVSGHLETNIIAQDALFKSTLFIKYDDTN